MQMQMEHQNQAEAARPAVVPHHPPKSPSSRRLSIASTQSFGGGASGAGIDSTAADGATQEEVWWPSTVRFSSAAL
jgi:hypothetical protein